MAKDRLSAGRVPVGFRSVTSVWKKTFGDLPVVGSTGSALIAGYCGHSREYRDDPGYH